MSSVIVICPKCRRPTVVDGKLRHVIESVKRVGCDDCLRQEARKLEHLTEKAAA